MLDISADILQNIHCGHFAALVVEKHGDDLLGGDYGGYKITQVSCSSLASCDPQATRHD